MVPSDPEMLAFVVPLLTHVDPGNMNHTFALQIADDLRYSVFGWYQDEHANMIFHQVPFEDLALFLPGQHPQYITQILS